jgi:hypothetical protein
MASVIGISVFTLKKCETRQAPLPPELAAVQCDGENRYYGRPKIAGARVTFLCIKKGLADAPALLRCDMTANPPICEDAGMLFLARDRSNKLFATHLEQLAKSTPARDDSGPHESAMIATFNTKPPQEQVKEEETNWKMPLGKVALPNGFTKIAGPTCSKTAVFDKASCHMDVKSASLYWRITIDARYKTGTHILEEDYRPDVEFWLGFLGKLVEDPAGK